MGHYQSLAGGLLVRVLGCEREAGVKCPVLVGTGRTVLRSAEGRHPSTANGTDNIIVFRFKAETQDQFVHETIRFIQRSVNSSWKQKIHNIFALSKQNISRN